MKQIDSNQNNALQKCFFFAKFQYFHFKVWDSDSVSGRDSLGEATQEVDPFVTSRATKQLRLSKDAKDKSILAITPA